MSHKGESGEAAKKPRGRFVLPHRGDTRVVVGEPIRIGGERPWLCAVKLIGRKEGQKDITLEAADDADSMFELDETQTLLVRTGRGGTPEEAQRDAMAQLTLVYGSPLAPPPEPRIAHKASDPPPPPTARSAPESNVAKRGPFAWIARLFGRG